MQLSLLLSLFLKQCIHIPQYIWYRFIAHHHARPQPVLVDINVYTATVLICATSSVNSPLFYMNTAERSQNRLVVVMTHNIARFSLPGAAERYRLPGTYIGCHNTLSEQFIIWIYDAETKTKLAQAVQSENYKIVYFTYKYSAIHCSLFWPV